MSYLAHRTVGDCGVKEGTGGACRHMQSAHTCEGGRWRVENGKRRARVDDAEKRLLRRASRLKRDRVLQEKYCVYIKKYILKSQKKSERAPSCTRTEEGREGGGGGEE
jgi:hypothetical protein